MDPGNRLDSSTDSKNKRIVMRDQGCGSGKSVVFIRNQVGRIVIREDGCGSEKSLGQIHLQPMDCDPGRAGEPGNRLDSSETAGL